MNDKKDSNKDKNSLQQETGEATFSIVRYFKYIILIGILSGLLLGGTIYALFLLFSD